MVKDTREPRRLTNAQEMPPTAVFAIASRTVTRRVTVHWHEFYELMFAVSGEGTHIVNGNPHRLIPGSMALLTPADFHEIHSLPGSAVEMFNVIFTHEMLSENLHRLLFNYQGDYIIANLITDMDMLKTDFSRLAEEAYHQRLGYDLVIRDTLECILVMLARRYLASRVVAEQTCLEAQSECIHRALVYIQHYFRGPLTLEGVAKYACLSPNYFSERFHKAVGVSFQNFLQDTRLQFAVSLLAVTDLSVTSVCHSAGFNTLGHFERAFTKKFGKSPVTWRRDERARISQKVDPPISISSMTE